MKPYEEDAAKLKEAFASLQPKWDGKESVLELKKRNYQWRQMEWIGWYFELMCRDKMPDTFTMPGRKYGNTEFDCMCSINWDMKSSAIKTDSHKVILNDMDATDASIKEFGAHGIIMALVDVDYNDGDRTFQKWHSKLKGGISKYEQDRVKRNAFSRYRKTAAVLHQILFLAITGGNKKILENHNQGRNADGSPRNPKYCLNIENADKFEVGRIDF